MHGPRLDSQLRQIKFLFNQLEIGMLFVRTASKMDQPQRSKMLRFAEDAHGIAERLSRDTPTTPREQKRLERELGLLKLVIDAYRKDEPGKPPGPRTRPGKG